MAKTLREAAEALDYHVLSILNDRGYGGEFCLRMSNFIDDGMTRDMAVATCRSLRQRGLAEFHRGLWSEDGEPAGSGYCITEAGKAHLEKMGNDRLGDYSLDLSIHLRRQRDFSDRTFGPGLRTAGVSDHIMKELAEVEADPTDLKEWVDVIILAFDGATRCAQHLGFDMSAIVTAMVEKQTKNEARKWPDWRTANPTKAIEHLKEA